MFTNPLENMNDGDMSKHIVPALVINNNDPTGAQRIKCRISVVHQGVTDDQIPWCRPIKNRFGSGGSQEINVPPMGSIAAIYVTHEDDTHNMYYLGVFTLDGSLPSMFKTIFPNCYGFVDPSGSVFLVNTMAKTMQIIHCGGAVVEISSSLVSIVSPGNVEVKAIGSANIFATGAVNIDGSSINLNGGANAASGLATNPQTPPALPSVSNLTDY
jgi:hypothetical protein